MILSFAEENYLKAIYHLSEDGTATVTTNAIADMLNTKAASVSDMLKKLSQKVVIDYQRYQGVRITDKGKHEALMVIRKHRLWEVFLVDQLKFNWDEVHEVAEQLEHIKSPLLIKRLDEFLGFPKVDPHGDPIPDENGQVVTKPRIALSNLPVHSVGNMVAVNDSSPVFLQYLDKVGLYIGAKIELLERIEFDGSSEIRIDDERQLFISDQVATNLMITEL